MRCAVIADVHANRYALAAVAADIRGRGVDVVLNAGDTFGYYPWAQEARGVLGDRANAFLAALEPSAEAKGVQLFHASPRDPVWEYILTDQAALAALEATSAPVVLVGHSHIPLAVTVDAGELAGGHAPAGTEIALGDGRWLFNPGSVGQPRDGCPLPSWLLLDTRDLKATLFRVDYDRHAATRELRAAGWDDRSVQELDKTARGPLVVKAAS